MFRSPHLRPEELDQPDAVSGSKFSVRRRSPSPFLRREAGSLALAWGGGEREPRRLAVLDPREDLVAVAVSRTHLVGVDTGGIVTTYNTGKQRSLDTRTVL